MHLQNDVVDCFPKLSTIGFPPPNAGPLHKRQRVVLQALQPVAVRDASQDDDVDISPPTPPAVQPSQPSADHRVCPSNDDYQVRQAGYALISCSAVHGSLKWSKSCPYFLVKTGQSM